MKAKTSNRTLPLLPQAEELLLKQKALIEVNKQMLGKSYNKKYSDYVCVDKLDRLILQNRLTHNFIKIIKRNQLRHIRFHNLRHSCASIMLKNGVPMKQIQEWLGHANFGTTANIYSHLNYTAKQNSANTISSVFNFVDSKDKVAEQPKQEENDKTEKLEEKLARLEEQLRQQQEDEEYHELKTHYYNLPSIVALTANSRLLKS